MCSMSPPRVVQSGPSIQNGPYRGREYGILTVRNRRQHPIISRVILLAHMQRQGESTSPGTSNKIERQLRESLWFQHRGYGGRGDTPNPRQPRRMFFATEKSLWRETGCLESSQISWSGGCGHCARNYHLLDTATMRVSFGVWSRCCEQVAYQP
jgi:hypothetical protein